MQYIEGYSLAMALKFPVKKLSFFEKIKKRIRRIFFGKEF
jgi:hypothetical protein